MFLQVSMREAVGVVHGDDILLSGPRSLVDAVWNSLRKRYEKREGPKDASEIIMLNRRVQWREASIRISPDPRQTHCCASWHSKASALSKNVVRRNSMTRLLCASKTGSDAGCGTAR